MKDLLVVIVLYRKSLDQSAAWTSLGKSGAHGLPDIFVYDNSPVAMSPDYPTVTYVSNPQNGGVSMAYNAAAAHAERHGKVWMLLLDQDSVVTPELLPRLADATHRHPASVAFVPVVHDGRGILSPFRFSGARGRRIREAKGLMPLGKYRFINSGLMIRRDAFVSAGGYDERIPLDFSDIAFAERLKNVTDHFVAVDVTLQHAFDDNEAAPLEDARVRFVFFCQGSKAMARRHGRAVLYTLNTAGRACKLVFRYGDPGFIRLYLRHFLYG